MADVNDHKSAKPEAHEDTHVDLHHSQMSKSSIPDKVDSHEQSKNGNSSLADKVSGELTSADWRNIGNRFSGIAGLEAKSILSLNPLAGQSDRAFEAGISKNRSTALLDRNFNFDAFANNGFNDFINHRPDVQQGWFGDQLKGVISDPFVSGRSVDNLGQMGLPVRELAGTAAFSPDQFGIGRGLQANNGNLSFWGEKILERSNLSYDEKGNVALGQSVTSSFLKDAMKDTMQEQSAQGESKGLWSSIVDGAKSAWHKVAETGSEILDLGKKAGNATIEYVGSIGHSLEHNTAAGKVYSSVEGDKTVISRPGEKMSVGPSDKNGNHDSTVETSDGRAATKKADGTVTLSNQKSDITIRQDSKTGKVEFLDKSGTKISEFNSEGEARRFFENSITQVTKPGQSLDDAYNEYLKSKPKELDKNHPDRLSKPILLMDGKGETLTVQPDGSRLYSHRNGDVDAIYKHVDRHGNSRDIEVKIHDGQMTLGHKGGRQWDCHSHEARDIVVADNTKLRLDDKGNLQVNQDASGDSRRAFWERFRDEHGHVHPFRNAEIDPKTGKVTIDDPTVHAEYTPDKQTGVTVETETKRNPDGTLDQHPSRVTTIDPEHKSVSSQGLDPTTGELKPDDKIVIDEEAKTIDAWDIHSSPDDTRILGPDGDIIDIDRHGDIHGTDADGNPFVDTKGDEVSYDGGHSYSSEKQAYLEHQQRIVTDNAVQTASIVDANASAMFARTDINASEVDALEQMLSQAVGSLPPNSPIPQQIVNAHSTLAALKNRLNGDRAVDQRTIAASGQANGVLREYAREAGNVGADAAAQYALDRYGLRKKEQKDKPEQANLEPG